MASPVCVYTLQCWLCSVQGYGLSICGSCCGLYIHCFIQGQNVYAYRLYTLLSLCASMRIFCCVWKHHKVRNVLDHL